MAVWQSSVGFLPSEWCASNSPASLSGSEGTDIQPAWVHSSWDFGRLSARLIALLGQPTETSDATWLRWIDRENEFEAMASDEGGFEFYVRIHAGRTTRGGRQRVVDTANALGCRLWLFGTVGTIANTESALCAAVHQSRAGIFIQRNGNVDELFADG